MPWPGPGDHGPGAGRPVRRVRARRVPASRPCACSAVVPPGAYPGTSFPGLIDLAAGVIALAWPGPTALVLVLVVASWAVIAGLIELVGRVREHRASRYPGTVHPRRRGLRRVRSGAVRAPRSRRDHPGAAVRPVQPEIYGARALVQGIELRLTRNAVHSALPQRTPASDDVRRAAVQFGGLDRTCPAGGRRRLPRPPPSLGTCGALRQAPEYSNIRTALGSTGCSPGTFVKCSSVTTHQQ